jgi:FkbM family methyltransferase
MKDRVALDIGAFNGDSAVILMNYAKEVYSFEPGPANFRKLSSVLAQNQHHSGKGQGFQIGLSDTIGTAWFKDILSSMASISTDGNVEVNLTTLDAFMAGREVKIGFVKCDTEGQGLRILRGAEQTLKKHRPVVSFAVYHNFDEFFHIPVILKDWLPDYEFGWEFGLKYISKWNEMVFLGYPQEILRQDSGVVKD